VNLRVEDRLTDFDQPQLAYLSTRLAEIAETLSKPEDYCVMQILADCIGQIFHELLCRVLPREDADRIWRQRTTN
jgi:hypothetical protein